MSEAKKGDKFFILAWQVTILAFIVIFWEWGARLGWIDKFFVSTPYDIVAKVGSWLVSGDIYPHLLVTLEETILGFVMGSVMGVAVGFYFAFSSRVDKAFGPLLTSLNAMPRVVFYPLFVMWFGLGIESKALFATTLVFFSIFFNTYAGLKEVDQNIVHQAKILGASTKDMVTHIYFPSALTWILSSLRISVGFSLVGVIVGEYISSMKGIGRIIAYAESMFNANEVMAGLFLLVLFIVAIDIPMGWIEKHFSIWKSEM